MFNKMHLSLIVAMCVLVSVNGLTCYNCDPTKQPEECIRPHRGTPVEECPKDNICMAFFYSATNRESTTGIKRGSYRGCVHQDQTCGSQSTNLDRRDYGRITQCQTCQTEKCNYAQFNSNYNTNYW